MRMDAGMEFSVSAMTLPKWTRSIRDAGDTVNSKVTSTQPHAIFLTPNQSTAETNKQTTRRRLDQYSTAEFFIRIKDEKRKRGLAIPAYII